MKRATWCAAAVLLAGCAFPPEQQVRVVVDTVGDPYVGDSLLLAARVVDGAGAFIPAARVRFASSAANVLRVESDGRAWAVAPGAATITAAAVDFVTSEAAIGVTVRSGLSVDSVGPDTVRFGDTLRIHGVGLNPDVITVFLGTVAAPVLRYTPRNPQSRNGPGTLVVWVPPPAGATSFVTVAGDRGSYRFPAPVVIRQQDLYEPNDVAPSFLGILDDSLGNPALAVESGSLPGRNHARPDWYVFVNPRRQDVTIDQGIVADSFVLLGDYLVGHTWSIGTAGIQGPGWTLSTSGFSCRGNYTLDVPGGVMTFRSLAPGRYHIMFLAAPPSSSVRRYTMRVRIGHFSVFAPDDAEENDYCTAATPLAVPGYRDRLSIDGRNDVDWYRFVISGSRKGFRARVVFAVDTVFVPTMLLAREDGTPIVDGSFAVLTNLTANLDPGEYLLSVAPAVGAVGGTARYAMETTIGTPFPDSALTRVRGRP